MRYSVFDDSTGYYTYYDCPLHIPINADLPVPKLPAAGNKIGVASVAAGRPLPSNAVMFGKGLAAMGIIAQPAPAGLAGLPTPAAATTWITNGGWKWIAGGLVIAGIYRAL